MRKLIPSPSWVVVGGVYELDGGGEGRAYGTSIDEKYIVFLKSPVIVLEKEHRDSRYRRKRFVLVYLKVIDAEGTLAYLAYDAESMSPKQWEMHLTRLV